MARKITRDSLIKTIARKTMINVEYIREFYDALEDTIIENLSSASEDEDVVLKLFSGISLKGVYVPEHKIRNNNVSDKSIVPSRIKPRFNVTKTYIDRLNSD